MIKDYCVYYKSPIGVLEITSNEDSILSIMYVEDKKKDTEKPYVLEEVRRQLDEYFNGKRKTFEIKIHFQGTDFQNKVWNELTKISYGEVVTYKHLSKRIGNKNAVRAVGNANGKNKINIIVPCHRVIGSNGKLTGYGGGLWRKEWLLEHEKKYSVNL